MESMTNHLYLFTKVLCSYCGKDGTCKINDIITCEYCGHYFVMNKIGNVKQTLRAIKK